MGLWSEQGHPGWRAARGDPPTTGSKQPTVARRVWSIHAKVFSQRRAHREHEGPGGAGALPQHERRRVGRARHCVGRRGKRLERLGQFCLLLPLLHEQCSPRACDAGAAKGGGGDVDLVGRERQL